MAQQHSQTLHAIRESFDNLMDLTNEASVDAPDRTPAELCAEARRFALTLIAAIIVADGRLTEREQEFVGLFVESTSRPDHHHGFLRAYAAEWETLHRRKLAFLEAAIAHDRIHKSDIARGMARELQMIGNNVAIIDRNLGDAERKTVRALMARIDALIGEEWV